MAAKSRREPEKENSPEPWTAEFVKAELQVMLEKAGSDKSVIFMKELYHDRGYSEACFLRNTEPFVEEDWFRELSAFIAEILEIRLVKYGLSGKSQPMCMFLLKKNYGYSDQPKDELNDVNVSVVLKEIEE